ncbi:hypothetical protein EPO44_22380, partial [bacterium]
RQAYAYLLYPRSARLTPEAEQRLVAMREFVELGSGLRLAMRDLEIRGAGNLLGPEQHGHLAAVGFDLYMRLLDEAIREVRGELVEDTPEATVDLDVEAYLPESYIAPAAQRMAAYRRLAAARTLEECEAAIAELQDRYGALPDPAQHLAEVVRLRVRARRAGVTAISRDRGGILFRLGDSDAPLRPVPARGGQVAGTGPVPAAQPGLGLRRGPGLPWTSTAVRGLVARWQDRFEWTPEGLRLKDTRGDGAGFAATVRLVGEVLDQLTGEALRQADTREPVGGER